MIARTWPYGTVKRVKVLDVIRQSTFTVIVCAETEDSREAHVCIFKPDQVAAEKGEEGTLTFTRGGPTGGFWQYAAPFKDVNATRIGAS